MEAKPIVYANPHLLEGRNDKDVLIGERPRHRTAALTVFNNENRVTDQPTRGQLPVSIEALAGCPTL